MQHKTTKLRVRLIVWMGLAGISMIGTASQNRIAEPSSTLALAKADLSRGELDNAEGKLWTILSSEPNQTEALTLLGVIRGRQKRYAEAEAVLRHALQLDPKSAVAARNLANALTAENKPDEAIKVYEDLTKLAPRDIPAKIDLAHLYLSREKFGEALSTLDAIPVDHFPSNAIPAKAASLLGLGRAREAAALIPLAEKSTPIAAETAEVFLDANAPQYALKILSAVQQRSPHPPAVIYYLKGRAQQATGDRVGALQSFRNALARDPKSVETLLAMAQIDASQEKHAESLSLLKRAFAVQPNSVAIMRPLVVEAMKAGERKTALRVAQSLADASSDNLDDQYLAAAALLELKDFETAATIFGKYVIQRPQDSKGFLGLGIAELARQHNVEANTALEQALHVDPQLAEAEYQLAVVAHQQGATAEELQHLERTIQLQPQHAKALANLGAQYLQAGEVEKARTLLERSVAADPNSSKSQYDFALALAKAGKADEASQHMERSRVLREAEDAGKKPGEAASHP